MRAGTHMHTFAQGLGTLKSACSGYSFILSVRVSEYLPPAVAGEERRASLRDTPISRAHETCHRDCVVC